MKKISVSAAMLVCYLFVFFAVANAAGSSIHLYDSWVREAPPSARVLAGFLSIMNHGREDMVLVSVEAHGFEKVEMHRTESKGKMSHMVRQEEITVPAGETVLLEPGGYHLMLMRPEKSFRAGDNISLKFKFKNGEILEQKAIVRKSTMEMGGHDNMEHDGH